jgi:hypothetical protein
MAGLLTLVISFLARLAGLGKVTDAVVRLVKAVQARVDAALDAGVAWIVQRAKALIAALASRGRPADPAAQRKLDAGIADLRAAEARYVRDGKIARADADQVAGEVKARHPIFKRLVVVEAGDHYTYSYVVNPPGDVPGAKRDNVDLVVNFTRSQMSAVVDGERDGVVTVRMKVAPSTPAGLPVFEVGTVKFRKTDGYMANIYISMMVSKHPALVGKKFQNVKLEPPGGAGSFSQVFIAVARDKFVEMYPRSGAPTIGASLAIDNQQAFQAKYREALQKGLTGDRAVQYAMANTPLGRGLGPSYRLDVTTDPTVKIDGVDVPGGARVKATPGGGTGTVTYPRPPAGTPAAAPPERAPAPAVSPPPAPRPAPQPAPTPERPGAPPRTGSGAGAENFRRVGEIFEEAKRK